MADPNKTAHVLSVLVGELGLQMTWDGIAVLQQWTP